MSDPDWRRNVPEYILDELETTREEISGRSVLDGGCGNGRWAYGFERLGCEIYGFDASQSGVEYARQQVKGRFDVVDILDVESLLRLYAENSFDIVWCWGVLHHTGDPERAFQNIAQFVKPGGTMHIYVYGKKSISNKLLRFTFNRFGFKTRVTLARILSAVNHSSVHSNFDGLSPPLASEHDEEQVEDWFHDAGFTFKRLYPKWVGPSRDLFASGIKQHNFNSPGKA